MKKKKKKEKEGRIVGMWDAGFAHALTGMARQSLFRRKWDLKCVFLLSFERK